MPKIGSKYDNLFAYSNIAYIPTGEKPNVVRAILVRYASENGLKLKTTICTVIENHNTIYKLIKVEKISGELKKKPLEKKVLKKRGRKKGGKNKEIKFTKKELKIRDLMSEGLSQADVAKKLNVSRQTVSENVKRYKEKLFNKSMKENENG